MRVAVLGDVHANAAALTAALAAVDAAGYDRLVFLGDLLTYGVDVQETLEIVQNRVGDGRSVVLLGNHDAIYRDILSGRESSYAAGLPAWIRESVDWTVDRLHGSHWHELQFEQDVTIAGSFFSHANPFGPGQWMYLNSENEHFHAALQLRERGVSVGVFGHTHRIKWYSLIGEAGAFRTHFSGAVDDGAIHILNAGAVGQPRDLREVSPSVLWLDVDSDGGTARSFERQMFDYDVGSHLRKIQRSGLSKVTVSRIVDFFSHLVGSKELS
jgi:predicted phosphodiesterase